MTSTTVAIATQNTPTHVGCLFYLPTSTADCDRDSQRTLLGELSSGQIRRGRRTVRQRIFGILLRLLLSLLMTNSLPFRQNLLIALETAI